MHDTHEAKQTKTSESEAKKDVLQDHARRLSLCTRVCAPKETQDPQRVSAKHFSRPGKDEVGGCKLLGVGILCSCNCTCRSGHNVP